MPEGRYRHIRVRHPSFFNAKTFKTISKLSHLSQDDQKHVRNRVPKKKRAHAKYVVGKLKGGKKITGRSWKLQKIMVKK